MKVQFYCSSSVGAGYQMGEFGADGQVKPCSSVAAGYFNRGDIKSALVSKEGSLMLVLRKIVPSVLTKYHKDRTGAHIFINIAFVGSLKEEDALRALMMFYYKDTLRFSDALYEAYQSDAPGMLGYSFSSEKINKLISRSKEYAHSEGEIIKQPPQLFKCISPKTACECLRHKLLLKKDAIYFIETDLSYREYIMRYNAEDLPWFAITEQKHSESKARGKKNTSFLKRVLSKIYINRDGKLNLKRVGISVGSLLGIAAVVTLGGMLVSHSATEPRPTEIPQPTVTAFLPLNTALPVPTETPLPIPTETPLPIPTGTPLPNPTETPLPVPTETPLPEPTQSRIPQAVETSPTNTPDLTVTTEQQNPDKIFVIKYEETEEGMLITRCMTDSETLFVLDFTFDGRKIIGIEKNALNLCTDLKLLVLGENILSISEDAIKDWSAIRIQAVPGTYAWNFAAEKNILAEDAESFKSEGEIAVEEGEQTVLSEENENAAQYDEPLE